MPKQRKTPRYLKAVKRSRPTRIEWKWEPSKELRNRGWTTEMFGRGVGFVEAVARAEALNEQLDAWYLGAPADGGNKAVPAAIAPANRFQARWSDLVQDFRVNVLNNPQARDGRGYSAKTIIEYESNIRWLTSWAEGGNTRVSDIDHDMVMDLRNLLVRNASPHVAKARLRILSILMSHAESAKMIPRGTDPAKKMKVPEPRARRKRIAEESVQLLAATARGAGLERMALAIELGFYALQRSGDLRTATVMHWRKMNDLDPADRAILCGPDGLVYGLRFQQAKTGAWIGNAVHHDLRVKVEARIAAMQASGATHILFHDATAHAWHEREFNRDWIDVLNAARAIAGQSEDADYRKWMIDQLAGLQFRDFRRSGMCWLKDNGATKEQIASRSGHSIREVEKILEVYMPADERGSARAFATAFAGSQQRTAERNEG